MQQTVVQVQSQVINSRKKDAGKNYKRNCRIYYVHVVEFGIYECKAKGAFRKEKVKLLVGDNVEIDVLDEEKKLGNVV